MRLTLASDREEGNALFPSLFGVSDEAHPFCLRDYSTIRFYNPWKESSKTSLLLYLEYNNPLNITIMKGIKIIFIALEIGALIGVFMLSFSGALSEDGEFFKSIYTVLFALLAVAMQKEQQNIDWYEEEV